VAEPALDTQLEYRQGAIAKLNGVEAGLSAGLAKSEGSTPS